MRLRLDARGQHMQPRRFDTSICPPRIVINGCEFQLSVYDEVSHVLIGPFQNRINLFYVIFLFLRSVVSALCWLVVSFASFSALSFAHADNTFVEHLIFLQFFTTETTKARWEILSAPRDERRRSWPAVSPLPSP